MKTNKQAYTSNVTYTYYSNSLDQKCCEPSGDDQTHFFVTDTRFTY